jgi:pyruvate,water dikinase
VSRELGTPAVVGTEHALSILKNGMVVTVNGSKGEVYKGATFLSNDQNSPHDENIHTKTATKVYINLAEPELASSMAAKNVDGIGLLRAEFMMAGIGVHPKKMIRDGKKQEFIEKLASQIEIFCTAFNPRPVIYRASDFKTNEYRGLIGGREYEPVEPNPMLGYRGAFRYMHDPEVFALELEAIKIVRQKKNLKNLWLMVPFVRTVKELVEVKKLINDAGLQRSPLFRLWMMVEVPSTVILLDEFIKVGIDGISIGSNDLTMLLLGTDRDNSEVARAYDEQNPAVLWALEHTIKTSRKNHIMSSICGQAPSLYPDLLEKLISWGITSVSVSPDVIPSVRDHIAKIERKILR